MYFLYNDKTSNKVKVFASSKYSYYDLQKRGVDLCGQFGREDYATHWADYKNGKITEKEHRWFLRL
tara:strand:+ start:193 stop:390 length:198 start_codon:yes stop_codon:yes gene_type:complete